MNHRSEKRVYFNTNYITMQEREDSQLGNMIIGGITHLIHWILPKHIETLSPAKKKIYSITTAVTQA